MDSKDNSIFDLDTVCWQTFFNLRDEWQSRGIRIKSSEVKINIIFAN